ncbi:MULTISPECIES: nuclear transport factor 2 family protein [Hyphobacterium]|uniref:Nuclear transport factor 2 family protein n=1 Tax=Hyphobacterium vulgare TaxID=1736751 RepID=A0ABV6ZX76_9PROT
MLRTILISAALALTGTSALAQETREAETVARAYMDAYSRVDWDAMAALMSEDIIFADTTATGTDDPQGIVTEGREAFLEMLRGFEAQYHPIELGFVWDTVFASNETVVFIGHVNALYPTEDPAQHFRWRSQQVAAVTVRDGIVIAHRDFANYPGAEQGLVPVE